MSGFPTIVHVDDVTPKLANNTAFGVMRRGPFIVANYHYQSPDTFTGPDEAWLRECRGLIFDGNTGLLLSRRFHKFFNVNEREDTQAHLIDWSKPHFVMTKLDGSMVSPVPVGGDLNRIRWTTKMGITDVAMQAEAFAALDRNLLKYCRDKIADGYTPIFEWVSPDNRIVLDYPAPKLILTGLRRTLTGDYAPLTEAMYDAATRGLDTVEFVHAHRGGSADVVHLTRGQEDTEGVVVLFEDGHMFKIKTDWYVGLHRNKEFITNPRLIVKAYEEDKLDDVFALLCEADRLQVTHVVHAHRVNCTKFREKLLRMLVECQRRCYSPKAFALEVAPKLHPCSRHAMFRLLKGADVGEVVKQHVAKHVGCNVDYDRMWECLKQETVLP
jgi:RNA ligase